MKNKGIALASSVIFAVSSGSALAGGKTVSQSMSGWYQSVSIKNLTHKDLGIDKGDTFYIKAIMPGFADFKPSAPGSLWGSLGGSCKNADQQPEKGRLFKCTLTRIGSWSNDVNFGLSTNNLGSNSKSFIGEITISKQPTINSATITLNLPPQPKMADGKPSAITINKAGTQVAKITDAKWNKPKNVSVKPFGPDNLTPFTIDVAQKERIKGMASPSKLSLKNGDQRQVDIQYKDIYPANGAAKVVSSVEGSRPDQQPKYKLVSNDASIKKEGKLAWGQQGKTITNIPTRKDTSEGLSYTLTTPGFVTEGTDYEPNQKQRTVVIKNGQTQHVNVHYNAKAIPTETATVNVSGLPNDQKTTITLSDGQGNTKSKQVGNTSDGNGVEFQIPENKRMWTVSASSVDGFQASVNPRKFEANDSKKQITVTYTEQSFIYAPYKSIIMNFDWNDNVISTNIVKNDQGNFTEGASTPIGKAFPKRNKAIKLSFLTGQCGDEEWAATSRKSQTIADANIKQFTDNNIDYIISAGGAAHSVLDCEFRNQDGSLNLEKAKNALKETVNRYESKNFAGIDYDIEGYSFDKQKVRAVFKATKTLQQERKQEDKEPLRVSLTLASFGNGEVGSNRPLNWGVGKPTMDIAKDVGLENFIVNLMTMNFDEQCIPPKTGGTEAKCDMGASIIKAAKLLHKNYDIPYSRIAVTPMIGANNVQNNKTTKQDMIQVAKFVKNNNLAGLHYWSYDRDLPCPEGNVSPTCNGMGENTEPMAYNKAILDELYGSK